MAPFTTQELIAWTTADLRTLPEVGTRWYIGGSHWQVIRHVVKEGEPAVMCRPVGKRKPVFTWIWRLAGRKALPSSK